VSVVYHVKAGKMGQWAKALGARLRPTVTRALRRGGAQALPILRDATRAYPIKAFGHFMRGWRAELVSWDQLDLKNIVHYARFVESGRRAGARQPPVMALVPWVQQVLGVPAKRARNVAFLVARKIALRGIAARPVLTDPRVQLRASGVITQRLLADLAAVRDAELRKERR